MRFTETVSTGIVTDNVTGKEYNCEYRINDELLELINQIAEENKQLQKENKELREEVIALRHIAENIQRIKSIWGLLSKELKYR